VENGITFERTNDFHLVKKIATHPKLWPLISDDLSPDRHQWEPSQNPEIWYVLARGNGVPMGLFVFLPENPVHWRSHVCILPEFWGDIAAMACTLVFRWMWKLTKCERITGTIPISNRRAIAFAVRCGMTQYGVNPKSVLRNGRLEDQVLLGISKEGNI